MANNAGCDAIDSWTSPEGFVAAMSAVYRTDAPPGNAGRWFIDRLKQGSESAARKHVQSRRRKRG
jgi:hypothetical protein